MSSGCRRACCFWHEVLIPLFEGGWISAKDGASPIARRCGFLKDTAENGTSIPVEAR